MPSRRACCVSRERDYSRCESGVVRGEGWWGWGSRVNIEGKYASRSPIVSDLPRLLARHILGPYRSNSGGTARVSDGCGFRVGGGRGVAARAGWGCSRWCSRSTVGVAIIFPLRVLGAACCSVSTGTAVAPALLPSSGVSVGMVSSAHSAAFEPQAVTAMGSPSLALSHLCCGLCERHC